MFVHFTCLSLTGRLLIDQSPFCDRESVRGHTWTHSARFILMGAEVDNPLPYFEPHTTVNAT